MRKLLIIIPIGLLSFVSNAQDCFNQFNNMVTTSVCLNHTGFEIMEYYASQKNPMQERFVNAPNGETKGNVVKSFELLEKSGNFINIHQYGFIINEDTICISYKILERYKSADVGIMINTLPVFNKVVLIDADQTSRLNFIVDKFILGENKFDFGLVLEDSDLKHITMPHINLTVVAP